MYSEYSEIYTCEPCILDEDRSGMMLMLIWKPHAGVRLKRTFHFNWKCSYFKFSGKTIFFVQIIYNLEIFNEWNEFMKVDQMMYTEYTEIFSCDIF